MYKCAHGLNPLYLNELFINKDTPYNLRDSNRLQQLEFQTVRYGFKSFRYYGLKLWNALPTEVKQSDNLYHWNITSCHGPHLHAILRIISRGVSGLATDSPCGVWGRGWTTCLLHDSPLFGSHFKTSTVYWCIASKLKAPRNFYWMSNMFLWVEIFIFIVCYHVVSKRHSQLDYELNGL